MSGVGKMMSNVALKIAVSALAIGTTMVACKPATQAYRPSSASARAPKAEQQAAALFAQAQTAAQSKDYAQALALAEQAVEAAPRDAGYRLYLADLYIRQGRFQSAETTFDDVLTLDPSNIRAGLGATLAAIALGKPGTAVGRLENLPANASPADVGLAYALAGQSQRAVELLEAAARAPGASGRIRQNLALAYALAGDWQKARTTAAQDVSPAELGARMEQWAVFAQPKASWDQVASLLGVQPAEDAGQPVRLALAPPASGSNAYAAAVPDPVVQAAAVETAPVQQVIETAAVEPSPWSPAPVEVQARPESQTRPEPQPQPVEETRPVYAEAIQTLVTPQPEMVRASAPQVDVATRSFDRPASRRATLASAPHRPRVAGPGRFVVQLGAYSSPAGVERAWAGAYKRYGLGSQTPLSTTVKLPGRSTLHRLSVAGFDSHAAASQVCRSVKAKGGACFVRAVAGDAPTQWAWRYTRRA
jgi:tetratricopeptide (TPR) repeat protein